MANPQDSEAHFSARAKEYGVTPALLTAMDAQGIKTMAHLAFAVGRPGAEIQESVFDTWARDVNGGVNPSMGELAALRRLHFESDIIVTAALKASVESPDQTVPKQIPFAERTARTNELRLRLQGIDITGINEPSFALLDECCQQHDLRVLKYVEPARCTSREIEISHTKSTKKLKLDTNSLTVTETKSVPDESISATYHLAQCLLRRALAYDFAGLLSFAVHQKYNDKLLRHLSLEPPPGFQSATMTQILRADREVFTYMSQHCADIRPAGAVKPLDAVMVDALKDYNTAFHLLPLPKEQFVSNVRYRTSLSVSASGDAAPPPPFKGGGKSKGKGKQFGKGPKGSGGSGVAPKGFLGCVGRDPKGRPLCFDFNITTCPLAPPGGACPNGRHNCFKAACFKPHAFCVAHASEMPKPATPPSAE